VVDQAVQTLAVAAVVETVRTALQEAEVEADL
jgi:hypothetical protein